MTTLSRMKFAFDQISPEIVVEILGWLSPYDLLTVKVVSSTFLYLIRHNTICWIKARQNLGNIPPPPPGLSESAYASYLFCKSRCLCCNQITDLLPVSFSFRVRTCSETCTRQLFAPAKMYTISLSLQSLRQLPYLKRYLPFASWLPYEIISDGSVVYFRRHAEILHAQFISMVNERGLTAAEEEYRKESPLRQADMAAQMKHSAALYKWSFGYLTKRKHVMQANENMIKNFARQEGIKLARLNTNAKIQQTREIFGKSLTHITYLVIRDICWATLKDVRPCPELPQSRRGRIQCSRCNKVFLPGALLDHFHVKHS